MSECKLLLKQTEVIEEKILEIHQKQLKGQSSSQAENTFLKVSCQLDTYGVDPHPVKVASLCYQHRYLFNVLILTFRITKGISCTWV